MRDTNILEKKSVNINENSDNIKIKIKPIWYLYDKNTLEILKKFLKNGNSWNNIEITNNKADYYLIIDAPSNEMSHNSYINRLNGNEEYDITKSIIIKTSAWKQKINWRNYWSKEDPRALKHIKTNFDEKIWTINKTYNNLIKNKTKNEKKYEIAIIINDAKDTIIDYIKYLKKYEEELYSKTNIFINKKFINDKDYDTTINYDDPGVELTRNRIEYKTRNYEEILKSHQKIIIFEEKERYINNKENTISYIYHIYMIVYYQIVKYIIMVIEN